MKQDSAQSTKILSQGSFGTLSHVYLQKLTTAFFAALAIITFWYLLKFFFLIPPFLLPTPFDIFKALLEDGELIFFETLVTLREWAIGLFFSIVIGLVLAFACYSFKTFSYVMSPLLVVSQSVPYLVFAPLLLLWFGVGMLPKIIIVILTCSFPIALVVQEQLRKAHAEYEILARCLKLSSLKSFYHIYFPYCLPGFFNALKISMSYSFVSTVLAEFMGSVNGLGVYMITAQSSYKTAHVFAAVVVIVFISLTMTALVSSLLKIFVFWEEK